MIRKLILTVVWFPLTMTLLILNLTVLAVTSARTDHPVLTAISPMPDDFQVAVSQIPQVLGARIVAGDARALLLESFLTTHGSPLAPYAETIVNEADTQGIDFRLVSAIAMCESNLGKRIPSSDSFNAWGIAVYTGTNSGKKFSDWPTAIAWVSKYLKEKYYDRGITDLKQIGAIYAPPSVETGYSWTNCVDAFQQSIF